MIDNIKATGAVRFVLTDENGKVKEEREFKNLVVTTGLGYIASRMNGSAPTSMSHFAVGTDSTAAVLANTTLGAENGRVALSSTTVNANQIVYTASVPAGTATGALVEAGLFNASSAGTMLARTTFSVINKGASDSLTATWTITIS